MLWQDSWDGTWNPGILGICILWGKSDIVQNGRCLYWMDCPNFLSPICSLYPSLYTSDASYLLHLCVTLRNDACSKVLDHNTWCGWLVYGLRMGEILGHWLSSNPITHLLRLMLPFHAVCSNKTYSPERVLWSDWIWGRCMDLFSSQICHPELERSSIYAAHISHTPNISCQNYSFGITALW